MKILRMTEEPKVVAGLHPHGQTRIKAAAAIVGVHPLTLRRWWQAGKFMKPTNINGILLFKNSDLIAWLEQQHSDSEVNHEK